MRPRMSKMWIVLSLGAIFPSIIGLVTAATLRLTQASGSSAPPQSAPPTLVAQAWPAPATPTPVRSPSPCDGDYVPYPTPPPGAVKVPPAAAGDPNARVRFLTPPTVTTPPILHGPFRLVAAGYRQPLHSRRLNCPGPSPTGTYRLTRDVMVVRSSSLFKEPRFIPSDYRLTYVDGEGFGNAEQTVALMYEGSGNPIVLKMMRLQVLPVDYWLPVESPDYPFLVERTQVAGVPALIDHQAFRYDDDVSVRFVRGEVLYTLRGRARTLADVPLLIGQLRQMAESLP